MVVIKRISVMNKATYRRSDYTRLAIAWGPHPSMLFYIVVLMKKIKTTCLQLSARLIAKKWSLVTAESCTGGWVAKAVTDIPGSSAWFERGFITYSNESKQEMLGVNGIILERSGAVSQQVVREMAAGALQHSNAQIAVAISGIAGPGGGTRDKPCGLVCFAWACHKHAVISSEKILPGNRKKIRKKAVLIALRGVLAQC